MKTLNEIISQNIIKYRKLLGLTQLELASKLNYSDKAISKWERGESLPDIEILVALSNLFGITLNELCYETPLVKFSKPNKKLSRLFICILSVMTIWCVATTVFVALNFFIPTMQNTWLCFIYALPASAILLLVFNSIWGKYIFNLIFALMLIWTAILSICLTINNSYIVTLYIIGIPLSVIVAIWILYRSRIIDKLLLKIKNHKK